MHLSATTRLDPQHTPHVMITRYPGTCRRVMRRHNPCPRMDVTWFLQHTWPLHSRPYLSPVFVFFYLFQYLPGLVRADRFYQELLRLYQIVSTLSSLQYHKPADGSKIESESVQIFGHFYTQNGYLTNNAQQDSCLTQAGFRTRLGRHWVPPWCILAILSAYLVSWFSCQQLRIRNHEFTQVALVEGHIGNWMKPRRPDCLAPESSLGCSLFIGDKYTTKRS